MAKKNTQIPTPPVPYLGAPDWLADAGEHLAQLGAGIYRLDGKTDPTNEVIRDLVYLYQNASMSLTRAQEEAQRQGLVTVEVLEILRDAWGKVRKFTV